VDPQTGRKFVNAGSESVKMLLQMENDRFHMETGYTTEEVKRFMEVLQQYALRAQEEENAN